MKHLSMLLLSAAAVGCSQPPSAPDDPVSTTLSVTSLRPALDNSIQTDFTSDPYAVARPYEAIGVFDSLGVELASFAANPEIVTDSAFSAVALTMVDGQEEVTYTSDGLYVEGAALFILSQGGGGGGEMQSTAYGEEDGPVVFDGFCEDQFARHAGRCRRLPGTKARALCWAAAMAVYAGCRAAQ